MIWRQQMLLKQLLDGKHSKPMWDSKLPAMFAPKEK